MRLKKVLLRCRLLDTMTKCSLRFVMTILKVFLEVHVPGLTASTVLLFSTTSKKYFRLCIPYVNCCDFVSRFGLDLSRLGEFIEAVKKIVKKTPTAFPLQGILMRFSDKSDIYMSTAYGRQTVHFEFYLWNRRDTYNRPSGSLAGYQTILQTLVI